MGDSFRLLKGEVVWGRYSCLDLNMKFWDRIDSDGYLGTEGTECFISFGDIHRKESGLIIWEIDYFVYEIIAIF